jgi:hypothetical protein
MSMTYRRNASRINMACAARPVLMLIGLALLAASVATFAVMFDNHDLVCSLKPYAQQCLPVPPEPNPDCTLLVPDDPLTARGLATPYQLVATNPADGECHETNPVQSAFVEAVIVDPATGEISIYRPLVIDQGTTPAVAPVVPALPHNAVVGLWFGYNGANLTLGAAREDSDTNECVQGFGQFAYCNAPAFFAAAHNAIEDGRLRVPPLGIGADGKRCLSVRHFAVVDQDQSDNLLTTYLVTPNGQLAQNTAENRAQLPDSSVVTNPSDERLLTIFLHPALDCTSWMAPDLTDPGHEVGALALNELQAGAYQKPPQALIPAGDPFVLNPTYTGDLDLAKVNAYRRGVDQPEAATLEDASTTTYCRHVREIAPPRLELDRPFFEDFRSPFPELANTLFTFMALRFMGTYELLNCQALLGQPDPVMLITNGQGIVIDATFQIDDMIPGGPPPPRPAPPG